MSDELERKRSILVTAYNNPNATQAEIATACDCPPSEVSAVLHQYDHQDEMKAQITEWNQRLGLDASAGLDRPQNQDASPDYQTEVVGILTSDRTKQSERVQDTGYDAIVEESIRGFLYLLPWTEPTNENMTFRKAVLLTVMFFIFVAVVVWALWAAPP